MRKTLLVVTLAVAAAGVYVLPEPESAPLPTIPDAPVTATPAAGVWYCPWIESSFEREGMVAIVAAEGAVATVTFPNPEPGGTADTLSLDLAAPGASLVELADVALRGDVPGFVEFSETGTAAAAVIAGASTLAAESCLGSVPKVWYLTGGSTRQGEALTLRLFNPFPETAIVSVAAASEFGAEPLTSLQSVSVLPRTWTDIDFGTTLRLRDTLAVTVSGEEGIVLPAYVAADADDEAMWVGSGLSREWNFPVVGAGSLAGSIALFNPLEEAALVEVDLITPEGPITGAEVVQLGPGEPVVVDLSNAVGGTFGARVRSDSPIAGAVVSRGGGGLAATVGAAQPAESWLLPGAGVAADSVRSLWLMNPGEQATTVTLRAVGADGAGSTEKVDIPAGSLRQFIVEPTTAYLAESLSGFVAGWAAQSPEAAAFSIGVPVSGG